MVWSSVIDGFVEKGMGKLYSNDEKIYKKLSTEDFVSYHSSSNVIAAEALVDYFGSIKDTIAKTGTFLFDSKTDRSFTDASNTRFETLSVAKRINFTDIANETVGIPERFDGHYTKYLRDLIDAANAVIPDTISSLNNLKMAIAGFINEVTEDGVLSIYGRSYSKESDKLIEKHKGIISSYFPTTKSVFKAKTKDVIRGLGEVEGLYNDAKKLEAAVSLSSLEQMTKLAAEVSEMVDDLIKQNTDSGVLLKNSEAKKDLISMIHSGAKSVEFSSYLYANSLYFYKALKSLSEKIIEVGNR